MKNRLPALLILANSQDALTNLCGISLLERLRRIARKLGFAEAMILSNSVESIAVHAGKSSWRRGEVALKFREVEVRKVIIGEVLDCLGAMTLPPDGRVLIVSAGFYCDERLLRVLAEAQTDSALIDSDPPSLVKSFSEDAIIHGIDRLPCALLLSRNWLIGKDRAVLLRQAVASEAMSGRIALVDAAQQPAYVRSLRGNVRPVFFPAPLPERRALAERLLQDATRKHVLDFPAVIHAPIENWLILRLCRTSATPNQLTLTGALLGAGVALLYALGYLWAGALLALVFGVWDGVDGKLARLNEQTTELGKKEHILDYFIEMSWWTALAYHFHASGQVRYAYALLIAFIVGDFFERLARRSVEPKLGRSLNDVSRFDRLVRLVAGRRNIYTWLFAFFLLLGAPATGFVFLCCWGIASNVVHIIRAGQIRTRGWR
ncbi:MAG TPA: CDP-alcohol phosphatidyltransferase family protein [Chthoniobacterales bacterium]|nr:CDP-alcohol phosphatidyltransferase family protein [Chthoniobacterales bacterium]